MKPDQVAEQVVYKFVKKIYEDELVNQNKKTLTNLEIEELVEKTYSEKESSLRKRILTAINKLCTPEEKQTDEFIENLLQKIFKDPQFNKSKIIQEIKIQQSLK